MSMPRLTALPCRMSTTFFILSSSSETIVIFFLPSYSIAVLRVLEIETALDLFARLIQRIVELLLVDARHDIERRFARQVLP